MSVFEVGFCFCCSYRGTSVLMYAKMPQNSDSLHLRSSSITSNLWLAPSCSALPLVCFPFTDVVPPSLPFLFGAAFFWSLSPLLDKEWRGQKREDEEDGGMSNSVSCCCCQNIALAFFVFFSASFVQNSWSFSLRWHIMVSDSEVGTFDRHLMWQQMDIIYCSGHNIAGVNTFLVSDLGMFKGFIDSAVCLTLLEINLSVNYR